MLFAMERAIPPVGEARNDFQIFTGLAERLGIGEQYPAGRDALGWLRQEENQYLVVPPAIAKTLSEDLVFVPATPVRGGRGREHLRRLPGGSRL